MNESPVKVPVFEVRNADGITVKRRLRSGGSASGQTRCGEPKGNKPE